MFASTVDAVNFWEESGHPGIAEYGTIRHEQWLELKEIGGSVVLRQALTWMHGDQPMLYEERRLSVSLEPQDSAVRCDWRSRLTAVGTKRMLTGTTPYAEVTYHGLGMRFARALDCGGQHLNPRGVDGDAPESGTRSPWHIYQGKLDEDHAPVGIWVGDHPDNATHPTPWFTLSHPPAPFAYVSATPMAHGALPIPLNSPVELRYSIWVRDEHWTRDSGDRAFAAAFYQK
jgi:hypothetical protein